MEWIQPFGLELSHSDVSLLDEGQGQLPRSSSASDIAETTSTLTQNSLVRGILSSYQIPIMISKMSLVVCILLFTYLTVPFCAALENLSHNSNHSERQGVQMNVTSAASSFGISLELNHENSTDIFVSPASDNALKTIVRKPLSENMNLSENSMASIITARQAGIIWKRIHELLLAKVHKHEPENSTLESSDKIRLQVNSKTIENYKTTIPKPRTQSALHQPSEESNNGENKLHASGRQFVFHPFLPYGKEVDPDEKISFHDVLPIKMVKFIKGMVEDAPWEQMFMKMVRMVVDQFVDKIIEKMFAHDEKDEGKWRSLDGDLTPIGNDLKPSTTSVVRLRRSAVKNKLDKEEDWSSSSFSTENRLTKSDQHKEKGTSESESWLDSILDYLFPEESKSDSVEDTPKTRRKKDIESAEPNENLQMPDILNTFFVKLYELQTGELASEQLKSTMKKVVHHQLLSSVVHFHSVMKSNSSEPDVSMRSGNPRNSSGLLSAITERWMNILKPEPLRESDNSSKNLVRLRRSAMRSEEKEDSKRLWQANRRSRPMNLKARGECSLRRACNTGRLLARLPSVKDITLQLKSVSKEPHWDALVWGMTKKKCSKIFCKRQRSPKGSKHHWGMEERSHYRNNIPSTRSPRFKYDESDPASSVSSLLQLYE